jgi:HD-GYP domain-containing protein (c-di-GMP phosphodiesterase class II)
MPEKKRKKKQPAARAKAKKAKACGMKAGQDLKYERMEKELKILREVAEVTNTDFDLNAVLGRFLDISMDITCADAGSMLLIDRATGTLNFTVARGQKADRLKKYRLALGEGIAGWVAQSGKPLITPDAVHDKRFHPTIYREIEYKTRNIMCVPIKFEDDTLGVIELLNKKGGEAFDDNDLQTLTVFMPYIAVIIKNAQLFIENKKRIHSLEHLMEMAKYVNSTLNLDDLLSLMLDMTTEMLNAEAGSILLLDDDKDELVFVAATGAKKEKIKDIRVPIGEGIAGWVARESKAVLIADAQNDPRFFKKADQKTDFKTRTIIAVPLVTKEKLIGVAEVLNKKNNEFFTEDDRNLFEALGNQAAVAIENAKLYENLRNMFLSTVRSLASAIETKDVYTHGHSERVTQYAEVIGKELGLNTKETEDLRLAGLLHDIGKIGVDERILQKPSKLTPQEFEAIKKHPEYAANILKTIPQLKNIIPVVLHHHERFDGNGYPDGLKGSGIPYNSRILGIADTFDAMSSSRPYREALPIDTCFEEIKRCSGTQFDPEMADTAVRALKKYMMAKAAYEQNFKNEKEK